MSFLSLNNKWFVWPLFLFLLIYCLLRAWFVHPLLDELGTFYMYIQTGKILGGDAIMDANNHILNSYFGAFMLRVFGDHFFGYRLLSVLSLIVYFFATKRFVSLTIDKSLAWLVFIALNSVPWIFEYFSYSRGYALSLGLFISAFCFLYEWKEKNKVTLFGCFLLLLALSCVSNLSLVIPALLLFGYSFILLCFHWKKLKNRFVQGILLLIFIAFMLKVYSYLHELKISGALWWGSTEGLWQVTGKSLLRNILFTELDYWKYILLVIFLIVSVLLIYEFRKSSIREIFKTELFWISGLFTACLISAVFMAEFMNINYPMDRVGMHLVPLFILVLGITLSKLPKLKWSLLILLWFPLSFIWKMNLNTSIFSPEDRIQTVFLQKLSRLKNSKTVISADYVSHINYAYLTRNNAIQHLATEYSGDTLTLGDYHISWVDELNSQNYKCIYREPLSGTRLYKRTYTPNKSIVFDTFIDQIKSKKKEISLLNLPLNEVWKNKQLEIQITGSIKTLKANLGVNLIERIDGADQTFSQNQTVRFSWYFGNKKDYKFCFPNQGLFIKDGDKNLKLLFTNPDAIQINLKQLNIQVYLISKQR